MEWLETAGAIISALLIMFGVATILGVLYGGISFYDVMVIIWNKLFHPIIKALTGRTKPLKFKTPVFQWSKPLERMTGLEYEHEAARWLVTQGYRSVTVTSASNDFGADITALDKQNRLWVFQCKLYSSKLDNTPIQEVVGSKAHYGATCAGVITNSEFTKAARQLAVENNVKLITLK